ncbi:hypothetical protein [Commensalibacter oyaizuii]|uniref:DUF2628 domain-containing protein n=1 Tax=Commensalibacter oyaizuii TaxID=3043873 RepID=A0ABT6Q1H7_9PROT|nr:hypothetical protein [Commensalibacter sp. TBRC 16381]MDI2090946.1 hypothetical protein [Commensalibacter sp. TBRC 16381]
MAQAVRIKNKTSGMIKNGYVGYSWTYLFFGWFVPLFRGEIGIAILHFIVSFLTCGLWQIIFSFLYNKQYMTRMLGQEGWELADSEELNALARQKLKIIDPAS